MNLNFKYTTIISVLIFAISIISCKEEWNDHYYASSLQKSDKTIYEFIHSRADMSIYDSMLCKVGYDSILNQSQTFTVWVPLNSSLTDVDLNDLVNVKRIVENHITKYSHPTVEINGEDKIMTMMNKKLLVFGKKSQAFSFDASSITESDLAMKNGIIHVVDKYVAYKTNFWEFLNETLGIDSLRTYVNSLTKKELDLSLSYDNGVFIDSIFKYTNNVTDYLADLSNEDSIYTATFPTNTAWVEAYNRIRPYYNCMIDKKAPIDSGTVFQNKYAKWTLVRDIFFRGNYKVPTGLTTLPSTTGTEFIAPDRLFEGAQTHEMSNGMCYITDLLKFKAEEAWNKNIIIEAEHSYYGRTPSNYDVASLSSIGTGFSVSNGNYLNLTPSTTNPLSTLFVQFPIPNTLSTKYNVYCVFVPTTIVDPTDTRPYKVKFYVNYTDSKNLSGTSVPTGFSVVKATVDANNNLQLPSKVSATFTTDGTTVQKFLVVKNLTLPFCNLYQGNKSAINFSLIVQNAATLSDVLNYNRNIRIDCIILEPVQ